MAGGTGAPPSPRVLRGAVGGGVEGEHGVPGHGPGRLAQLLDLRRERVGRRSEFKPHTHTHKHTTQTRNANRKTVRLKESEEGGEVL